MKFSFKVLHATEGTNALLCQDIFLATITLNPWRLSGYFINRHANKILYVYVFSLYLLEIFKQCYSLQYDKEVF